MKRLIYLLSSFLIFNGCRTHTGDVSPLAPPSTRIFLNQINLSDSNSLSGKIKLSWLGESSNGYIKGYEISSDTAVCSTSSAYIQGLRWFFTSDTDSSFLFKVPRGQQYSSISFYVRAIDNHNSKDPVPPCLNVPVKNAFPSIKLDRSYTGGKAVTDTVHSVFTLSWTADDADGPDNLDSIYVKFNNSQWIGFSKSIQQATFVPLTPDSPDSTFCKILTGTNGKLYNQSIGSLKTNDFNTIYIRSKDISNSYSLADTVKPFYYKRKTGDVLFVDSYKTSTSDRGTFDPILKETLPSGYDVYDMNRNSDAYLPQNWNLTFAEYLKLYKKVFWASDISTYGGSTAIELGVTAIQTYLNQGGKIWVSMSKLPSDINSPIYQFSPFDSISSKSGQARLANGAKVSPLPTFSANYDTLSNTLFTTGATPGYVKITASVLYSTQYISVNGWSGPNVVAAIANGPAGKPNQVYFTLDVQNLNGNNAALKKLFDRILNQEFAY